jgi:SAM-dependent methyltransferase
LPPPLVYEASVHSSGEVIGLSRCPDCLLYFTRPRLVDHNVDPRVTSYEYVVAKYGAEARSNRFHKNGNYRLYLGLAASRLKKVGAEGPYSVLDIGSHCGFFVRFASENGWKAYGVEPAPPMVRFARELNRVTTLEEGFFDERAHPGRKFHLVTMFDVLEHIPDPVALLSKVRARLEPGGLILCKVPHVRFYLGFRRTVLTLGSLGLLPKFPTFLSEPPSELRASEVPPFFDLFEHVVHYDENGVRAVLPRAGFDRFELLPAPPTNPPGHYLNLPRSAFYQLSKMIYSITRRHGRLTHGLIILGSAGTS